MQKLNNMFTNLRNRLDKIVEEEYQKVWEKYPVSVNNQGEMMGEDVSVLCVLKTDKLGIVFWHGPNGSGYSICELVYTVHKNTFQRSGGHSFHTFKEAETFLKKTKSKEFKDPFMCCITKEYSFYDDVRKISDITFEGLDLKDLEVRKTIVIHPNNRL